MITPKQSVKEQEDMAKKQMESNPDYLFGSIIDEESKVSVNKITAQDPVQFIFISLMYIYEKYSIHENIYPSFNEFSVNIERDDKALKNIKIEFNEKDNDKYNFLITFDKIPDKYKYYNGNIYIEDEIVYDIEYDEKTTESKCTMMSIGIPYTMIDLDNFAYVKDANKEDYSDIHDTIFGYNMCIPKIIKVKSKCNEKDTPSYESAHNICRNKALIKKITNDIKEKKKYCQYIENVIKDNMSKIRSFNKSINNCKRAKKRLMSYIKKLNNE